MGSFLRISLIVSLIWLLTKLSFARFARSFQRRVYQERREKIRFEQFVLEQLQTAVIKVKEQSSAGTATDSPESDAPSGVSGKPRSRTLERFKTAVSNISVPKLTPLAGQEDYDPRGASMIEPPALQFDSLMDAKLLARDLYQSILELHQKNTEPMSSPDSVVAPDPASATLRIRTAADGHAEIPFSAFSGYFADPRLAKQAFSLFDLNSDGWASRYDFKEAVVKMYEDKQALHANIENGWQALDKLDSLISILLWVVSAILFLSVFLDLSVWIAAFASAWAGAVFAFQSSIKSLIESIIFLFVTHPFDVGDRISFQGDSYFVKAMTIMSSTLTHTDGREVYLSNPVLSQYFIYNIRRSGSQIETIRVAVDVTTTAEMFSKLTAELNKEIKETYYREFVPNLEAFIEKVKFEQRTATMVMWLTHRSNFQAGAARWRRTTLFMTLLKEKMKLCGIKAGQMKVIEVEGLSQYYAARSRDGGTMASTRSSGTRAARPPSFPGMPSDSTGLRRRI